MNETNMEERLRNVEQQVNTHEAVCAERYKGIIDNLGTLNKTLIGLGLMLLAGMTAILAKQIFH